jgi:hypothetical protein
MAGGKKQAKAPPSSEIYELRLYDVVPGRLAEEVARMHEVSIAGAPAEPGGKPKYKESLFDRHGVARPIGAWTSTAGSRQPMFIYMQRWDSLTQREKAFPSFWADPIWRHIRTRSDAGSDMVTSLDTWLVRPSPLMAALPGPAPKGPIGGVHEMRIQQLISGDDEPREAMRALAEVELPLVKQLGGHTIGIFNVLIGPNLPAIVIFYAWPDLATQQRAWARLDVEPRMIQQRDREQANFPRGVFGACEQFLLSPVPGWGLPAANFGAKP